jgi:hypothetical protein
VPLMLVHASVPVAIVPPFALRVLVEQQTWSTVLLLIIEIFDVTLVARSSVSPGVAVKTSRGSHA